MDLTHAWVVLQKHKGRFGAILGGIVLFGAGWQLGRVMSPYYASHPIVFTESSSHQGAVAGDPMALQELREQGIALRSPEAQVAGAIASQTLAATSSAAVSAAPEAQAAQLYVGSVNSDLYHHRDCAAAKQIKEENKVWFATPEEAEVAGYTASKCTQDRLR